MNIYKYDRPKEGRRGGATVVSASNVIGNADSSTADTQSGESLWSKSQGVNALVPKDSVNIAVGDQSAAIGFSTQTSNDGEFALGEWNKSTKDVTLFSVGDGESEETRHNIFAIDISGFTSENGVIGGNLQTKYLIADDGKVNGKLDVNELEALSGYIKTLLSDEITCDYLTVTKAAHFFSLIIDEIKATMGAIIITPANCVLAKVEKVGNNYRCYYRSKDSDGKQIHPSFEVNDQVVCQTFNAATGKSYNVSNTYYWRLCVGTGTTTTQIDGESVECHYIDLSDTDKDQYSISAPSVGDNCVQLGNRSDSTRQQAIILSAYNSQFLDKGIKAPSFVQYAGINDYDLSKHRMNIISDGLNEFKGGYLNNQGKNIESIISENVTDLNGKITNLTGVVTSHTKSISDLQQTDEQIKMGVTANTESIGNLSNRLNTVSGNVKSNTEDIANLEITAKGIQSTVSSHTQSITTINNNISSVSGDVKTIKSDYVTSSQLTQTADGIKSTVAATYTTKTEFEGLQDDIEKTYTTKSELQQTADSISASVTNDLEGKLTRTGIDINSNVITLSADNTKFTSSSGNKLWLCGMDYYGNDIFQIGRSGNYSPFIRLYDTQYSNGSAISTFSPETLILNGGVSNVNRYAQLVNGNTENGLHLSHENGDIYLRFYNGTPQMTLTRAGTQLYINIDSSGVLHIGVTKNGTTSASAWPKYADVKNGEVYANDGNTLVIKS